MNVKAIQTVINLCCSGAFHHIKFEGHWFGNVQIQVSVKVVSFFFSISFYQITIVRFSSVNVQWTS